MRNSKKTLLIVGAAILTIASLAVLSFVRSKMEASDEAKTTAAQVVSSYLRAA